MLKSNSHRYGAVAVSIHWLTAILIILALITGFRADGTADTTIKAAILRVHIPTAVILLLLTVFRLVWWWRLDRKPAPVHGSSPWQEKMARIVHAAFYIVILGMIGSGIGMVALGNAGPAIFGEVGAGLPDFTQYPPRIPHGLGAALLLVLILAHVGAALWHQFIRKDGLIARMWFGR